MLETVINELQNESYELYIHNETARQARVHLSALHALKLNDPLSIFGVSNYSEGVGYGITFFNLNAERTTNGQNIPTGSIIPSHQALQYHAFFNPGIVSNLSVSEHGLVLFNTCGSLTREFLHHMYFED